MSGAQHGSGEAAEQLGETTAPADAAGAQNAASSDSPAPLTSLTSLLGGTIEGGTVCTTDGVCD